MLGTWGWECGGGGRYEDGRSIGLLSHGWCYWELSRIEDMGRPERAGFFVDGEIITHCLRYGRCQSPATGAFTSMAVANSYRQKIDGEMVVDIPIYYNAVLAADPPVRSGP